MSRTRHLTRKEQEASASWGARSQKHVGPVRERGRRAKTRLTKVDAGYWPLEKPRPKNKGGSPKGFGGRAGKRARKEIAESKRLGRRLERRRLNRELLP